MRPRLWPLLAIIGSDQLLSFLQRARSATRSKLLRDAVPAMGTFFGDVDESATGSLNLLLRLVVTNGDAVATALRRNPPH
jgi:hypothetical protein